MRTAIAVGVALVVGVSVGYLISEKGREDAVLAFVRKNPGTPSGTSDAGTPSGRSDMGPPTSSGGNSLNIPPSQSSDLPRSQTSDLPRSTSPGSQGSSGGYNGSSGSAR